MTCLRSVLAAVLVGVFWLFPSISYGVFDAPLTQGTESAEVALLQEFLKIQGYFTYPTITGYFGPITAVSVRTFQQAHDLPVDGIANRFTVVQILNSTVEMLRQRLAALDADDTVLEDTVEAAPPETPTRIQVYPSASSISISWNAVDAADEYHIKRSGSSDFTTIATTEATSYTDVHVSKGAYYTYVVTAENAHGESDPTPGVSVSVPSSGGVIDDAATITSSSTASVAENATLAHSLTANESVTWSLVGGADQARFELSGSTLRWTSNGTKDYESPDDSDTNNTYIVTVRATDSGSNTTDQTVTVTVTDVNEAWTPADMGTSTLLAWYKGDELSGVGGSSISSWTDSSGNGNAATQVSGSNQPSLATSSLNSMNTVYFGDSDYVNVPNIYASATEGSVYAVVKVDVESSTGDNSLWSFGTIDGNNDRSHYAYLGTVYDSWGTSARKTVGSTPSRTTWRIVHIHSAASDWAFWVDGGTEYETTSNTVEFNSTPVLAAGFKNGAISGHMNGHFAEVVLTNAKQATSTRQQIEGYLAHKWGITGNLDAGHPYKSTAP